MFSEISLLKIILNVKKDEVNLRKQINYIRVLGFNKQGRNYLKSFPAITMRCTSLVPS